MENVTSSTVELTKKEWESRKLTKYGNLLSLADTLHAAFYFGAIIGMLAILSLFGSSMISAVGYCIVGIFFVSLAKLLLKISAPLNSYQTVIIREE